MLRVGLIAGFAIFFTVDGTSSIRAVGRNRFIAPFRGQALDKTAQCAPAFAKPA